MIKKAATLAAPNGANKQMSFVDGKDHINISTTGETELGRMLSFGHHLPFVHPYFGPFNCMDGFWYYIRSEEKPDELRYQSAPKAKAIGSKLTQVRVDNFHNIIMAACRHKIDQHEHLKQLFIESHLPFEHYYLHGPGRVVVRPPIHQWLVTGMARLRAQMQSGNEPVEPDYSLLAKRA